uniref:Albumin domain-containing protein n=1 Tax=Rhizophora mucronata TaxID=61149 RepID=A0A2P2NRV4_RHIMU
MQKCCSAAIEDVCAQHVGPSMNAIVYARYFGRLQINKNEGKQYMQLT